MRARDQLVEKILADMNKLTQKKIAQQDKDAAEAAARIVAEQKAAAERAAEAEKATQHQNRACSLDCLGIVHQ